MLNEEGLPVVVQGARQQKGIIVDQAKEELIEFFSKTGLTITTFGLTGGLMYDDKEIQKAINDNFRSELEIKNQRNERLAQEETNNKDIAQATAKKLAAQQFALAAEAQTKMINLEIAKIKAEAEKIKAEKWNGQLPSNIMPEGSNFILGMK